MQSLRRRISVDYQTANGTPLPAPSPKRRGGVFFLLPPSASGEGWGGGSVRRSSYTPASLAKPSRLRIERPLPRLGRQREGGEEYLEPRLGNLPLRVLRRLGALDLDAALGGQAQPVTHRRTVAR